jgi:hypothetical protein
MAEAWKRKFAKPFPAVSEWFHPLCVRDDDMEKVESIISQKKLN